jgi:hypothetical protein
MDPSSADLAREAVRWILPEGASLSELGQVELQEFLWYQRPMKWMAETSQLHQVAWSLADLFTAAGLERYASVWAIDAGDLVPGERGWRQLAVRITEFSMMMARLDLRGGTLLESVSLERGQSWAAGSPTVRQDLLTQVLLLLAGEVAVPVEAG